MSPAFEEVGRDSLSATKSKNLSRVKLCNRVCLGGRLDIGLKYREHIG